MPIGLVAAGIGAAGAIGGAIISGNAASDAADTTAAASRDAQGEQRRQFDISQAALRTGAANANEIQGQLHNDTLGTLKGLYDKSQADNQPYQTTGKSALDRLAQIYNLDRVGADGSVGSGDPNQNLDPNGTFYQSPDYQFALNEGIKGVDTGASARGMLDSGATRKAEIKYAGNLASGQFGNYAARLAALAGVGQTAAANSVNNNNTYGGRVADANNSYATQYGNAQLGLGTNLANTSTTYGNNYASSVQNAANNQANATLAQGANTSNAINGLAGQAGSFLNNNYAGKSIFGSSYTGNGNGEW